ncbi:ATP-binding protein [Psychrobacter faecalis]
MSELKSLLETEDSLASIGSPSDSFKVVLDIRKEYEDRKVLGEFVCFQSKESDNDIYSLGQITEVKTENKWHEEPSFKSVIKRHGHLPHLSGDADNRVANLNIQSSFKVTNNSTKAAQLSNSPATGVNVHPVNNQFLDTLIKPITEGCNTKILGKAYGSNVNIPFWFKHFGKGKNGAGDAYHIGVFGKTGSGKTTTAAQMILGYAANHSEMSMLIFDPQEQFYNDNEILPNRKKFRQEVLNVGVSDQKYRAIKIPEDIALPDSAELFSELLNTTGFINSFFSIKSVEKRKLMQESIEGYIDGRLNNPSFLLQKVDSRTLLLDLVERFCKLKDKKEKNDGCSEYISYVYSQPQYREKLKNVIEARKETLLNTNDDDENESKSRKYIEDFGTVLNLFKNSSNQNVDSMLDNILKESGYVYIVNLAPNSNKALRNDNVQALLIDIIMSKLIEKSEHLASEGKKANCLVVMDEAHRYVNSSASEPRLKELNKKIIDSVRTVRKYGIGHMFITQTIESIDQEVIQQMRVFAFGYGLTMGTEYNKIRQIVNDDDATKFYKSFIDPSSNGKYPFMFHGPISPLSFTGSPLFIEMSDGNGSKPLDELDSRNNNTEDDNILEPL